MILLDTNVISQAMQPSGSLAVRNWLDAHAPGSLFLCTPVLAELRYGVEVLPEGRKRQRLQAACDDIESDFGRRMLSFSVAATSIYGRLRAQRHRQGGTPSPIDLMIAAIALANDLSLATRNTGDFEGLGLKLINPFEARPA